MPDDDRETHLRVKTMVADYKWIIRRVDDVHVLDIFIDEMHITRITLTEVTGWRTQRETKFRGGNLRLDGDGVSIFATLHDDRSYIVSRCWREDYPSESAMMDDVWKFVAGFSNELVETRKAYGLTIPTRVYTLNDVMRKLTDIEDRLIRLEKSK